MNQILAGTHNKHKISEFQKMFNGNGLDIMILSPAAIPGFPELIESRTGIYTRVADDAISCVAEGTGKSLDWVKSMQDGTMNLSRRKQMN